MKKQTAVEWLEEQIRFQISNSGKLIPIFEQAKKMEKEQIIDSYYQGDAESDNHNLDAEQYYQKTFSMKKQEKESKSHSFCETPNEKCTMNYCDENGCQNRKRELVELKEETLEKTITPKGKAIELVEKFKGYSWTSYVDGSELSSNLESAKQCALIAVDEILTNKSLIKTSWDIIFWNEVKQEIENL